MIINFNRRQISAGHFLYQVSQGNKLTELKFERSSGITTLVKSCFDGDNFELMINGAFGKSSSEGEIRLQEAGSYSYKGKNHSIYYCGKKGSNPFNGIYFWKFNYFDEEYYAYEVGNGHKGICYCIWKENSLVAIVSKGMHTKRFESDYIIYADDAVPFPLLNVISAYWDITGYFPTDSSEEWHTLNTWQKELKTKYDSTFIPRIKEMENSSK